MNYDVYFNVLQELKIKKNVSDIHRETMTIQNWCMLPQYGKLFTETEEEYGSEQSAPAPAAPRAALR